MGIGKANRVRNTTGGRADPSRAIPLTTLAGYFAQFAELECLRCQRVLADRETGIPPPGLDAHAAALIPCQIC